MGTHVGGLLNALLVTLMAVVFGELGFSEPAAKHLLLMFVCTARGNTVFCWAALFTPNRALTFGDNRFGESNLASMIGLVLGLIFVIVSLITVTSDRAPLFRCQTLSAIELIDWTTQQKN